MTSQCIQCQVTSTQVCSACNGYGQANGAYCVACDATGVVSAITCANVACANHRPDLFPPIHDGH